MADLSVILRRVLRRRIRTGEGLDRVVGELLGDDWQKMLSNSNRNRDGIIQHLSKEISTLLNKSSFVETGFRNGDTSIDLNRNTVMSP